jgi:hypothetical protein
LVRRWGKIGPSAAAAVLTRLAEMFAE